MRGMFSQAIFFNQDLSHFEIEKVTSFESMLSNAKAFDQNLCFWGSAIQPTASVKNMFVWSYCPSVGDPILSSFPKGSIFSCL
jgi:hypothetical protein